MFRAAHRSSSGALNCICSLWFIYTNGNRPFSSHTAWTTVGHHIVDKPEAANTVWSSDYERCAARNMLSLQSILE